MRDQGTEVMSNVRRQIAFSNGRCLRQRCPARRGNPFQDSSGPRQVAPQTTRSEPSMPPTSPGHAIHPPTSETLFIEPKVAG
jgi:hypothetical protein